MQHVFEFEFEKILIIFDYNPTNKLNPYRQNTLNTPPRFFRHSVPKMVEFIAIA
jgi:hypothetical protein